MTPTRLTLALAASAALAIGLFSAPGTAAAAVDPPGCTKTVQYDASIPTFKDVVGVDLGQGSRRPSADLYLYLDALVDSTAGNPRVIAEKRSLGVTPLGKDLPYAIVSSPANHAGLEEHAAFWRGAREGTIPESILLSQAKDHPTFGWITANVHGNEPAGGEASLRFMYELLARTDCHNLRRLQNTILFIQPVQNPDGRDANGRTTSWAFDANRDWASLEQVENRLKIVDGIKYPPVFYIDAHQQSSGYFFPPNEDPVHHEISDFAIDFINFKLGPALQQRFNDQSIAYQNYNAYDLFVPQYGDTVPSLLFGAAGMTLEKGTSDAYGKEVYDHYLAIDEIVNVTSREKDRIVRDWILQWSEAAAQGAAGELEPNQLVSPLHQNETLVHPTGSVYGYYYLPDNHAGDAARLIQQMLDVGVHVYRLDAPANVTAHTFGPGASQSITLPAGTIWIPSSQSQKHWIQAILGEDPFPPYSYQYDVATWSWSLLRGMAGNGFLTESFPSTTPLTEIEDPGYGVVHGRNSAVLAYAGDSTQALAMTIELLDAGATVYRAAQPFTAGTVQIPTGGLLVDSSSLLANSIDIDALADKREIPVYGLSSYPVSRYALVKPKIGLFAGTTEPTNPIRPGSGSGRCGSTAYCVALHTLANKIGLTEDVLLPVTSGDITAGRLANEGFTALINPNGSIAATSTTLRDWVNAGGRYIGNGTSGVSTGLNHGMTTAVPGAASTNEGSTWQATFNTASPVAWGFDNGGFLFRSTGGEQTFAPVVVPPARAAASYASPARAYGRGTNGQVLAGAPAVIDQPLGSGAATLITVDPFFRAWVDSAERFVLNGALYPTGSAIAPDAKRSEVEAAREPAGDPLPRRQLRRVKERPVDVSRAHRHLIIRVDRSDLRRLGTAVRAAKTRRAVPGKKVVFRKGGRLGPRLVIRFVRTDDFEKRAPWVGRLMHEIDKLGISYRDAQV